MCALWSPWVYVDLWSVLGLKKNDKISGLHVYSLAGSIGVYVDDVFLGNAVPETPLFYDIVMPGKRIVRLERNDQQYSEINFWKYEKFINFIENTTVVASFLLGPTDRVSEGQIIYASERKNKKDAGKVFLNVTNTEDFYISVNSSPSVFVEGKFFEINFDVQNQQTYKIFKDKYENMEFILLPADPNDRLQFTNYDLHVEVHLMKQILEVQKI